jgi:hypothetical protein
MIQLILQDPIFRLAAVLSVFGYVGAFGILFGVRHAARQKKKR